MEQKLKLTEKEIKVLKAIENSEFSMDGNGLCGYICQNEFDMKIYRGVLSSLIKKQVIGVEDMDGEVWVWINSDFLLRVDNKDNDTGYVFNPSKKSSFFSCNFINMMYHNNPWSFFFNFWRRYE